MRGKLLRPLKSHNSPFNSSVLGCQAFNKSQAKGDLVMIQTLLLLKCKLPSCHANQDSSCYHNKVTISLTPNQRLATKYSIVKWPFWYLHRFFSSSLLSQNLIKNICFHPDQETSESVFERPDCSPQLQTPTDEPMGKIKYIYMCSQTTK